MRKLFAVAAIGMSAWGGGAASSELIVTDPVSYYDAANTAGNNACIAAASDVLSKRFDGIASVTISNSNIWESVVTGVENYAYANSRIESETGDVEAQIQCLVYTQVDAIIEISFQFSPPLKGGKRSLSPEIGSSIFVSQNTIQITGAN